MTKFVEKKLLLPRRLPLVSLPRRPLLLLIALKSAVSFLPTTSVVGQNVIHFVFVSVPLTISSSDATGYPLCEIPGYSYQQPVLDYAGSTTRSGCLQGCRSNDTCRAVAYKDTYGESCYFYRRHVEYDQVWEDKNSLWSFYDEVCQT